MAFSKLYIYLTVIKSAKQALGLRGSPAGTNYACV